VSSLVLIAKYGHSVRDDWNDARDGQLRSGHELYSSLAYRRARGRAPLDITGAVVILVLALGLSIGEGLN
jgi:hypothetical protein